jgi:hypothetical protein
MTIRISYLWGDICFMPNRKRMKLKALKLYGPGEG